METIIMETSVELIQELEEFLSVNRHYLTGEDIILLNQVIEELKKVDKSSLDPAECLMHLAQISDLILKLFEVN